MQPSEIPSQYDPKQVEARLYSFWLDQKIFTPSLSAKKQPYCIILPPPNVTGVLHMGHALTCTIEDILCRYRRMQGCDVLWLPGTDHAGIATQMVVEKQIYQENKKTKHDLGREAFLKRVWEWKERSQNTILSQMKVLGCSVDWTRLKFTLDPDVSNAVRECFYRLYQENLIYRDEAIIQWCPRCRTALSDLEVKFQEKASQLWGIRYLLKGSQKYITVATTRPETLLGDVAVAVHPDDERYTEFLGKTVLVPLIDREVPVIADAYVDRTFGTGALKITPGHDPNDYVIGKRHQLEILSIMDDTAKLTSVAGPYSGLTREEARERVLHDLKNKGLLEKEQDYQTSIGHCDRCGVVVEPRVSRQWFVKAEILAKQAIEVVEKKEIQIIPQEWEKTYFSWMKNIRPWCISRQLWWGHRIPVWYCQECSKEVVAVKDPARCDGCGGGKLKQDDDVLDTWFSSGLWPFSTLGWPEDTPDFRRFYPTRVMETGFDILFFWVARMVMLGLKMTGKIPFHTVYLHPMVRDEYGQKMSKTKGNVVDPLEIVSTMGADSLRFFFASNAFHGRDIRVSENQLQGCRNFVNKIWNASRFLMIHFSHVQKSHVDKNNAINRWIWACLNDTKRDVTRALDQFRFFDAANILYHFIWDTYCYWFIEFIKEEDELKSRKEVGESTAIEVLEEALRLLHPLMPFVTEELWQNLPLKAAVPSIAVAPYPEPKSQDEDEETRKKVDRVCRVIDEIRKIRGVNNISPAVQISAIVVCTPKEIVEFNPFSELIKKLSKLSRLDFSTNELPQTSHTALILSDLKIFIPHSDLGEGGPEELQRKKKELSEKQQALERAIQKLENAQFMSSAPEAVKEGVKRQRESLQREVDALQNYLKGIKS